MPSALRRTLLLLAIALFAWSAHEPLFRAGAVGDELEFWDRHAHEHDAEASRGLARAWTSLPTRPLTTLALAATSPSLAADGRLAVLEPRDVRATRAFALACVLAAAIGAASTLRRCVRPWTGESAARASAWALAALAVAHPLSVAAVARPSALGDVLATALGTWALAIFLRARQEKHDGATWLAVALLGAAGFASSVAWIFVPLAVGLEWSAARRPRSGHTRAVAALVVGVAASACVSLEWAASRAAGVTTALSTSTSNLVSTSGASTTGFAADGVDLETLGIASAEKLGVLFLPVPAPGAAWHYAVAGALILLALQPLLRAVRAAPRTWGWMSLAWSAALASTLAATLWVRVAPNELHRAESLWPASILMAAGLAVAATAVGGARRIVLPFAVACGFAWIAHDTSSAWRVATEELRVLANEVSRALHAHDVALDDARDGEDARDGDDDVATNVRVIVVDPPARTGEFVLPFASFARACAAVDPRSAEWRVRGASFAALPYVVRCPDADAWRREGLTFLLPKVHGERAGARATTSDGPASLAHAASSAPVERITLRVPEAPLDSRATLWRGESRSPLFDLDPWRLGAVRVTPLPDVSTAEAPRIAWRAEGTPFESGSAFGAWIVGDDGPRAVFDLSRSFDWLGYGAVQRIWFESQSLSQKLAAAEVVVDVGSESGDEVRWSERTADERRRVTWPRASRPRVLHAEPEWTLVALDTRTFVLEQSVARRMSDDELEFATPAAAHDPRAQWLVWIEARVGDAVVARAALPPATSR